jgi:hypothetical protein
MALSAGSVCEFGLRSCVDLRSKVAHDSAAQLPAGMRNEVSDPRFVQPLEQFMPSAEECPKFWRKPLEGLIGNFLLCAEAGREL